MRFQSMGMFLENTHISAATRHRILKLVSNLSEDISLLLAGQICKLSNLNIHAFQFIIGEHVFLPFRGFILSFDVNKKCS